MLVVYKYEIPHYSVEDFELDVPKGANFLDVQIQDDVAVIWFLVPDTDQIECRNFLQVATGDLIAGNSDKLKHLATLQFATGHVRHLFEKIK